MAGGVSISENVVAVFGSAFFSEMAKKIRESLDRGNEIWVRELYEGIDSGGFNYLILSDLSVLEYMKFANAVESAFQKELTDGVEYGEVEMWQELRDKIKSDLRYIESVGKS